MPDLRWNKSESVLPKDDTLVDTLSEGGLQTQLVYWKRLWWHPDKSMYMYYTPAYWRPVT